MHTAVPILVQLLAHTCIIDILMARCGTGIEVYWRKAVYLVIWLLDLFVFSFYTLDTSPLVAETSMQFLVHV